MRQASIVWDDTKVMLNEGNEYEDCILGWINQVVIPCLKTKNKSYCAVIPCPYHGFKRDYFETEEIAEQWIRDGGQSNG